MADTWPIFFQCPRCKTHYLLPGRLPIRCAKEYDAQHVIVVVDDDPAERWKGDPEVWIESD